MQGSSVFMLGRKLDANGARSLAFDLLALRGQALQMDGSMVEAVGGLAVEVLIAAGLQWQADGLPIELVQPSVRLQDTLKTLGLSPDVPWLAPEAHPERNPT